MVSGFSQAAQCFFLIAAFSSGLLHKEAAPIIFLSVQPVVARERRGKFSRLGFFLSEKLERSQNSEKI